MTSDTFLKDWNILITGVPGGIGKTITIRLTQLGGHV